MKPFPSFERSLKLEPEPMLTHREAVITLSGVNIELAWPIKSVRADTEARFPRHRLIMPEQRDHTHRVAFVDSRSPGSIPGVDGLVFSDSRIVGAVTGADCLPIVLRGVASVAIIHAGWRGTEGRVAARVIELMKEQGDNPRSLQAYIGPSIQVCDFEVDAGDPGRALTRRFANLFGQDATEERDGRSFVNLQHANLVCLTDAGIDPDQILIDGRCTVCSNGRSPQFPSWRRDRDVSQLLVISVTRNPGGGYEPITPNG